MYRLTLRYKGQCIDWPCTKDIVYIDSALLRRVYRLTLRYKGQCIDWLCTKDIVLMFALIKGIYFLLTNIFFFLLSCLLEQFFDIKKQTTVLSYLCTNRMVTYCNIHLQFYFTKLLFWQNFVSRNLI